MSVPLKTYRVYRCDLARPFVTADFVRAGSDEEAIAEVESRDFGSKCEIWQDRRLVAQLESERLQA